MKYSVVIPVYNSERTLNELCTRIKKVFESTIKEKFEIILVNDCSKDKSWQVIQQLHESDSRIKIINFSTNCGQQAAILCGLKYIKGDFVITMDDDLQHPPEEIPKLINHMLKHEHIDIVMGSYINKEHSMTRNMGSNMLYFFSNLIFKPEKKIKFTSFKIMRAFIASEMTKSNIQKSSFGALLRKSTSNISSVPVAHHQRPYGRSGYTYPKLVKKFTLNIFSNSILPLKLISVFGMFLSFTSFTIGLYFLVKYFLHGSPVKGWTSIMVMLAFFSGFILFTLGIIGEYLLLILMETKKLPAYIIREKHL